MVHVQGGILIEDLNKQLASPEFNLALATQGAQPAVSLAGALSTCTKGTDIDLQCLSSYQQPFVSTTPARHSQGVKRRSISASPPRLINNNLPSISKILNNNSVKNTPLDINGEPNTRISNMESPLINMIQMNMNPHHMPGPSDFMQTNFNSHHQKNLPPSHLQKFKMMPQHHTIDLNGMIMPHSNNPSSSSKDLLHLSSLSDPMQQHFYSLSQSPPPPDQQQRHRSFPTMMNNSFSLGPIHHHPSHMYPSHHPMQSNDVGIPPKQQQQLTDEQLIRNLAEELKTYLPRN
ncbi:unnamed protein product [Rotaria sp. Silwood1]|nr:unnamed protein product [Rotaria sp. Silwood1]CAF4513106.1 unnamed protein product [Rotaria sp. Silwood1]